MNAVKRGSFNIQIRENAPPGDAGPAAAISLTGAKSGVPPDAGHRLRQPRAPDVQTIVYQGKRGRGTAQDGRQKRRSKKNKPVHRTTG